MTSRSSIFGLFDILEHTHSVLLLSGSFLLGLSLQFLPKAVAFKNGASFSRAFIFPVQETGKCTQSIFPSIGKCFETDQNAFH